MHAQIQSGSSLHNIRVRESIVFNTNIMLHDENLEGLVDIVCGFRTTYNGTLLEHVHYVM